MTTTTNFTAELVAMAKSHEELPKVQDQLASANDQITKDGATIARLETKLMDRANEINDLNRRLRELEAARDEAELRFLEADERAAKVLNLVRGAIETLEPVKPQPEPVKEPSSPLPVASSKVSSEEPSAETIAPTSANVAGSELPTTQANPSPAPEVAAQPGEPTSGASSPIVGSTQDATSESGPGNSALATPTANGPYSGLRYYDHHSYITLSDWLAGGGTEADYNWRPSVADPFKPMQMS